MISARCCVPSTCFGRAEKRRHYLGADDENLMALEKFVIARPSDDHLSITRVSLESSDPLDVMFEHRRLPISTAKKVEIGMNAVIVLLQASLHSFKFKLGLDHSCQCQWASCPRLLQLSPKRRVESQVLLDRKLTVVCKGLGRRFAINNQSGFA